MFFGKVIGSVVASVKDQKLRGTKLLVVQKVNHNYDAEGAPLIAVDTVQAGTGDYVYLAKGKEASLPFGDMEHPVDAAIVGIIDRVHIKK
jgi:Carbon dioxide concentrating mechanism/carboxysome shell protein